MRTCFCTPSLIRTQKLSFYDFLEILQNVRFVRFKNKIFPTKIMYLCFIEIIKNSIYAKKLLSEKLIPFGTNIIEKFSFSLEIIFYRLICLMLMIFKTSN